MFLTSPLIDQAFTLTTLVSATKEFHLCPNAARLFAGDQQSGARIKARHDDETLAIPLILTCPLPGRSSLTD